MQIAEIVVDGPSVHTPLGSLDRAHCRWFLGPAVPAGESCPTWAVVVAVLGALCTGLLSLLFLLIKETDTWSSTLTVTDGRVTFSTVVYSNSPQEYEGIRGAVAWAQQRPPTATGQLALPS